MKERYHIARKEHVCDRCADLIKVGEVYQCLSYRQPRYDKDDKQIGIEYITYKSHTHNCWKPESCKSGIHSYVDEWSEGDYPTKTGVLICEQCGEKLDPEKDLPF